MHESIDDIMNETFDRAVREQAAASYNAPSGAVPRDEMWARISAARRAACATPVAIPIAAPVVADVDRSIIPIDRPGKDRPAIWRWSALLAAGLLLGVVLDRTLADRDTPSTTGTVTPAAAVTSGDRPLASTPNDTRTAETPSVTRGSREVATTTRGSDRTAATAPNVTPDAGVSAAPGSTGPRDLYHAAAIQTLMQAEALLVAYRGESEAARDPQAMQQAARWAREVLSSTRLLMDSPAARDPQLRVLFTDLELILAQIVQLSGAPLQASERALIERALRDRDLLPRIRSVVPSGSTT
jgi:hypothetical protein